MKAKKMSVFLGSILIAGLGLALSQETGQNGDPNQARKKTETRAQFQNRFMDENGDGINDLARDHDNDGIPNCQDPDWQRPQDGTGSMSRHGQNGSMGRHGNRSGTGSQGQPGWTKQSFRQAGGSFGGGICDGTGPKGNSRKGRG